MLVARYKCSEPAGKLWRRLCSIYARAAGGEDPQAHGQDWGDWGPPGGDGSYDVDVGTDDRLLYIDSQQALVTLEEMGREAKAAAQLARRRLTGHGIKDIERRHGISREQSDDLLEGAEGVALVVVQGGGTPRAAGAAVLKPLLRVI